MNPTNLRLTESPNQESARPSKTKVALAAGLGLVFVIVVTIRVIEFIGGDETPLADLPSPDPRTTPDQRTPTRASRPTREPTSNRHSTISSERKPISRTSGDRGATKPNLSVAASHPINGPARRTNRTDLVPPPTPRTVANHVVDVSRLLEFNPFHPDAAPATSHASVTRLPSIAERAGEAHSDRPRGLLDQAIRWVERRVSSLTATDLVGTVEQVGELVLTDSPDPPGVEVKAIMTGGNRPAALIGNELYFENDQLGDRWKVVKIAADAVIVELTTAP